ncbi:MAG: 3'(2'),5'-bisphosphate nucleotidase CysQ [gamma proteobacterium symbiont of Taylorina sp.]|nr:3'(2'),5'-bisphosphate nucleotidase CysQ [gamma proteobacterium symbiont of Taylorina sp.]
MQTQQDLHRLLPEVIELAQQAGQVIMDIYQSDFQINNKSDNTPVTCADLAANEFIVKQLARLSPEIPILSEESTTIPYKERSQWQTYWLVDPLDGTRAFIEKTGEFSVNIALIVKNSPVLGVIYSPVNKCSFYACSDGGAFYLDDSKQARNIQVRAKCQDKIVVAGTEKSAQSRILQAFLKNLEKRFHSYEIKFMGSSLKSCMVAEGTADVYARLGPTSEWDTAAAQCIVEEAGGQITDTQMQALRYNTKDSLLNPDFFVFGDKSIAWNQFL